MKAFDELENQNIQWVQPSAWRNDFELQTDTGEVLAQLHLHFWIDKADLETFGNRWLFTTSGIFNRKTTVTSVGTGEVYATYHHNKSTLTMRTGATFRFKNANFWGNKKAWVDEEDNPIVGFKTGGSFRFNSEIDMDPNSIDMKGMPVLVYLGWYLLIKERGAAAAVVVAAT